MFRKRKPEPQARQAAKAAVKLTVAEKREISRILETARGDGKVHSAQDTLPFRQMYPDGLCKLDDHTWSKCIEFEDVNYQLAKMFCPPLRAKKNAPGARSGKSVWRWIFKQSWLPVRDG